MGTRNLTMVIDKEGETKVAQYGQWDGYPEGQGATVLGFLNNEGFSVEGFQSRLNDISFFTKEEIDKLDEDYSFAMKERPWLTRDTGADILNAILYERMGVHVGIGQRAEIAVTVDKLIDSSGFVSDSLFCEYAYVVDLQKGTFEVYEGFNKEPLEEGQRFKDKFVEVERRDPEDQYHPVKMIKEYKLDNLPTEEEFLTYFKELYEEQEEE